MRSPTQPLCPNCGKKLRKLSTVVYLRRPGERIHSDEYSRAMEIEPREWPSNKYDCQGFTNRAVLSIQRIRGKIVSFSEWDGERYQSTAGVFCSGPCALAFALGAYRAGYRIKAEG